ncbi:MAG: flagella basal body P-ring formation protein FlgA [Pseudomonadota bacterium]
MRSRFKTARRARRRTRVVRALGAAGRSIVGALLAAAMLSGPAAAVPQTAAWEPCCGSLGNAALASADGAGASVLGMPPSAFSDRKHRAERADPSWPLRSRRLAEGAPPPALEVGVGGPRLVRRAASVRVMWRRGGLTLMRRGRALGDGRLGERVGVSVGRMGAEVESVVVGPDLVSVVAP